MDETTYIKNVHTVQDSLDDLRRSSKTKLCYQRCYEMFGTYLEQNGLECSANASEEWLLSVKGNIDDTTYKLYNAAMHKLNDLYLTGKIRGSIYCNNNENQLCSEHKAVLESYCRSIASLSPFTVENHRRHIVNILTLAQRRARMSITDISYDDLLSICNKHAEKTYYARTNFHTVLNGLLQFLYLRGKVTYGYTLFVKGIAMRKGYYWNNADSSEIEELRHSQTEENDYLSLDDFLLIQKDLCAEHVDAGYSVGRIRTLIRYTDLFYLFMDMNRLSYSPEVAALWLSSIKHALSSSEYKSCRCILSLLEQQYRNIPHDLGKSFYYKKTDFDKLPMWCKTTVAEFMDMKQAEGWELSTLSMYRSSICRFCFFLDKQGITAFSKVTSAGIKQFNVEDPHATPAGKNAYNARIRKFLIYLGDRKLLSNPFLFIALPGVAAPTETLVVTLTVDEQSALEVSLGENDNGLSLRKKAVLQLGLHMGIRSSDIVGLLIDDIDWNNASIRFIQKKTKYEVNLPMPVDVANALFRYIMYERPETSSRNIFIRTKAPYIPLTKGVCQGALHDALPERDVAGSGFHVTRKTFATGILRSGANPQEVAETLGHRGTAAVHRYLSLDEENMRLCGLDLASHGLLLEGGLHYE